MRYLLDPRADSQKNRRPIGPLFFGVCFCRMTESMIMPNFGSSHAAGFPSVLLTLLPSLIRHSFYLIRRSKRRISSSITIIPASIRGFSTPMIHNRIRSLR